MITASPREFSVAPPAPNPLQSFGGFCLLVYIFIDNSRVLDFVLSRLRIPMVFFVLIVVSLLLTGALLRGLRTNLGGFLLAYISWIAVAVPFSVWRGGSMMTFQAAAQSYTLFFMTSGLLRTYADVRRALGTFYFAVCTVALLTLKFGITRGGRLGLATGKFANPDDLSYVGLIGLIMGVYFVKESRGLLRILALAGIPLILTTFLRTGARSGILALGAVVIFGFVHLSMVNRMKLVLAMLAVVAVAYVVLPPNLRNRYLTFTKSEYGDNVSAADSTAARRELLMYSIHATLENPLFGMGPGQFVLYTPENATRALWMVSHNTYTQISGECGIPAFLFFCAALLISVKQSTSSYKLARLHSRTDLSALAFCVASLLVAFAAYAIVASFAYSSHFPILAGINLALCIAIRAELQSAAQPRPGWRVMSAAIGGGLSSCAA